ncbi:MAG: sulfurtransferase [Rhodospirillaceae bacterium]|nr:sulfurtransferase [Rhodospirillaceae bacterium]|tara:strand:+ start:32 stop:364 length:333 start_codon:yes stop_codon:yes gene_type:complete
MTETCKEEFVDAATANSWLESGDALLIDVREAHEHKLARIATANLNPLSSFDPRGIPIKDDKKIIFHCASGVRCGIAAKKMMASGHEGTIYRLQGGIQAWHEAGYPILFE